MTEGTHHHGHKANFSIFTKGVDEFAPAMEIDFLKPILEAIQIGITKSAERIALIEAGGGDASDYDDELEMIENLLGVAFVACQVYITSIVSMVSKARTKKSTDPRCRSLTTKKEILQYGNPSVNTTGKTYVTQIQLMDAMANYYKHRDQWELAFKEEFVGKEKYNVSYWKVEKKKNNRSTIKVLKAIGAVPNSSGNFRLAAEILGNEDYDVRSFVEILEAWGQRIKENCQKMNQLGTAVNKT